MFKTLSKSDVSRKKNITSLYSPIFLDYFRSNGLTKKQRSVFLHFNVNSTIPLHAKLHQKRLNFYLDIVYSKNRMFRSLKSAVGTRFPCVWQLWRRGTFDRNDTFRDERGSNSEYDFPKVTAADVRWVILNNLFTLPSGDIISDGERAMEKDKTRETKRKIHLLMISRLFSYENNNEERKFWLFSKYSQTYRSSVPEI